MLLVDTNVLAYLLIEGDCTPAAQALYERDADWRSEDVKLRAAVPEWTLSMHEALR